MRAAIFNEVGKEVIDIYDDVEVADPGPGEVRLKLHAAGVCHSDLSAMNGTLPQPAPAVLGHEGAGEIIAGGRGCGPGGGGRPRHRGLDPSVREVRGVPAGRGQPVRRDLLQHRRRGQVLARGRARSSGSPGRGPSPRRWCSPSRAW